MRSFFMVLFIILIGIFLFILYWNYYNVYSEGDRKGTLIKITKKGNFFKTIEGEMWLSCRSVVNAEKFFFSVKNKNLGDSLINLQDECLQVTYEQYRNALPWRGDSEYVITGFKKVR